MPSGRTGGKKNVDESTRVFNIDSSIPVQDSVFRLVERILSCDPDLCYNRTFLTNLGLVEINPLVPLTLPVRVKNLNALKGFPTISHMMLLVLKAITFVSRRKGSIPARYCVGLSPYPYIELFPEKIEQMASELVTEGEDFDLVLRHVSAIVIIETLARAIMDPRTFALTDCYSSIYMGYRRLLGETEVNFFQLKEDSYAGKIVSEAVSQADKRSRINGIKSILKRYYTATSSLSSYILVQDPGLDAETWVRAKQRDLTGRAEAMRWIDDLGQTISQA